MTDQKPPRRPGYSTKVAGIRKWAQSPEAQRQIEVQRRAQDETAPEAAKLAEAHGEALAALKAAGFSVRGIDCSPTTARKLAAWVRQHTDEVR